MEKYLDVQEFTYELPEEKIAKYPLEERDASKLLVYKDGKITDSVFSSLPSQLPENSLLVFNNTKVTLIKFQFARISKKGQKEGTTNLKKPL